ncbi:MAG: septal ring lytic transglycosylase RlpA family protein [Alphaproteobacteria bacterium]
MFRSLPFVVAVLMLGTLSACQPSPSGKPTGNVKIGKPYEIAGKMYYPEYDQNYDRVGTASWYGPGFHGKYTANGELFDQNDLTAAHPTLPMPSLVRVTNLQTGKSAIIRVNDRGPFKDSRIIDLSKKSAQRLGIQGLAKVRVQFLQRETEEYLATIRSGQSFDMFAYNDKPQEAKIVENIQASSYDDTQGVTEAAPVMSVSSVETTPSGEEKVRDNLIKDQPITTQPVELYKGEQQVSNSNVVSKAWADDNVTLPEPEDVAPSAGKAPEKSFSPPPSTQTSGIYTIQAGVFSTEENAQKLVAKTASLANATIENVDVNGRSLWRVRVGSFDDKISAEKILADVRAAGVPDARVIKK